MRWCALLTAVLAGCAATPHAAQPPPSLVPFAAASRFVPDGMESYAFMPDGMKSYGFVPDGMAPEALGKPRCAIWAGAAFEGPRSIESIGPSRSIYIHDFGEQGIGDGLDKALAARNATRAVVAGHSCWHWIDERARAGGQREYWYAVVDDRFVLVGWHPDVLAKALQQRGDLATALAPFGDLSFLPADTECLILNLPRAPDPTTDYAVVPTEPMVFVVAGEPQQLAVYSRSEPPVGYRELLANMWSTPDPPVTRVGAWRCQSDRLLEGQKFFVLWLFGHRVLL